jgi:hypothetical protein
MIPPPMLVSASNSSLPSLPSLTSFSSGASSGTSVPPDPKDFALSLASFVPLKVRNKVRSEDVSYIVS